jgi:hypothetical protein
MLWGYLITGLVGVAGMTSTLLSVKINNSAQATLTYKAEKRRIYAAFNAAIESLWIIATSSWDFTTDPGRANYNQAMTQLWSSYFEVSLIAPANVNRLAIDIAHVMSAFAARLREREKDESWREPRGFLDKRDEMIRAMRADLGERAEDGEEKEPQLA